ncbi:PAS domain S-box-containing protein [Sphingobium sp. B2D3A]|uniref:PAS domain-containing protein n=1 Tax=Sphingobium TaxID=165695 RepID=UPI0015EC6864|nr:MULTISPECIES: PAS domain-containing protein [Sphingobium]MCW2336823.1 PAS domain S-box-containing protein [Sphingobium sp. B2D3A]MCW2351482.1 PAS domain S-box-containing protein [Sphingobium sp. B12D2B]MCW2362943.1 PAS domain S-box-containing protein [Sphingobium sp. B10D3B]MCW2365218.1 PAS domain S-box-containing protein [Sphingobium sp. B7D2B]MCW2380713.1 PAS domain S-box-containing protein [Sphingobium sp. B2D3B]
MTTGQTPFLTHSWPVYEASWRLPIMPMVNREESALDNQGIGLWSCRLTDESLTWSRAVYDLFGIPVEEKLTRSLATSIYLADSRAAMESLRAYAIRHRRGFTMDARLRRPDGALRWMRLTAVPVLCERRVVRLTGTKQDVTAEYETQM